MRQRKHPLRRPQAFLHLPGIKGKAQRFRIGVADIFTGHAHQPPGEVERIGTAVNHAREPIQGAIHGGAPYRFVQSGNLIIKGVAALIETPRAVFEEILHCSQREGPLGGIRKEIESHLKQIQIATGIAIGYLHQRLLRLGGNRSAWAQLGQGASQQGCEGVVVEGAQFIDSGAG